MTTPEEASLIGAWLSAHQPTPCPVAACAATTAKIPPDAASWIHSLPPPIPFKGKRKKPTPISAIEQRVVVNAPREKRRHKIIFNLLGNRYGHLLVEGSITSYGKGVLWQCRCDCGRGKIALGYDLRRGRISSCGCQRGVRKACRDLKGQRFGPLVVLGKVRRSTSNKDRDIYWNCQCDCGRIRPIRTVNLRRYFKHAHCWCPGVKRGLRLAELRRQSLHK